MASTAFEIAATSTTPFWTGASEVQFARCARFSRHRFWPTALGARASLFFMEGWAIHRVFHDRGILNVATGLPQGSDLVRGDEKMPTPTTERRLILGLGMLLFLLSCAYVPWEHRIYQVDFVHKTDADPSVLVEYRSALPSETRYGWVFRRPVAPQSIFGGSDIKLSAELNIQFLLVEWLGICLFTGGLILLWPLER